VNAWTRLWNRLTGNEVQRFDVSHYLRLLEDARQSAIPYGPVSADRKVEDVENSFTGYAYAAYKANGVVFATILARLLLFTEARFQWQRLDNGRPGDLFGTQDLRILEKPWPNGTTGELLARMEQDASLAGNFYAVREGDRIRRLRPDWVSIILTAPPEEAVQSDVMGYAFYPGGRGSGAEPEFYLPDDVCHWSPIPDPTAQYRGMSWITPILNEIQADKSATEHKLNFFVNGATLGPVIAVKETVTLEQFREFVKASNAAHQGTRNAYKPMYVGGGADVSMQGADLRQLDFKATQGAGETRITAAGGVPAVIVGLSEGLQAATYSNYGQARRKFGDHWARPQWRSACAALESILDLPPDAAEGTLRLWYDDRDIAFLREDQKDAAEIQQIKASTIRAYCDAGFTPESAVAAVDADDRGLLVHTGLFSVQLQPPMTVPPEPAEAPVEEPLPEEEGVPL
jgi:phage portal protein BeeE